MARSRRATKRAHDGLDSVTPDFDPASLSHPGFAGYLAMPIPNDLDAAIVAAVSVLRWSPLRGNPKVSDSGKDVLLAFAERSATRAVREHSVDFVRSALLAVLLGGLIDGDRDALVVMSLIDDAAARTGTSIEDLAPAAIAAVGPSARTCLDAWIGRSPGARALSAMGYSTAGQGSGFRYVSAPTG